DTDTLSLTEKFIHHNFNVSTKTRIYTAVINHFQRVNKRYELPFYIFTYLEKSAGRKQNHTYILARYYAAAGQKEKLDALIISSTLDKQLKIHINLSMYLRSEEHTSELQSRFDIVR